MVRNLCVVMLVVISVFVMGTVALAQEAKKEEPKAAPAPEVAKIDINSASLDVVEELPGIGIKLAQAIIDGRPYEKVEDLLKVKGIGEKRFAQIKDLVEVKPIPTPTPEPKKEEPKKEPEKKP